MSLPKLNAVSIGTSDLDDLVILTKKDDKSTIEFYYSTGSKIQLKLSKDIEERCEAISNVLSRNGQTVVAVSCGSRSSKPTLRIYLLSKSNQVTELTD